MFKEDTITYSGDDLKQLLDELDARTEPEPDDETVEYPLSPEEMAELLAAANEE